MTVAAPIRNHHRLGSTVEVLLAFAKLGLTQERTIGGGNETAQIH